MKSFPTIEAARQAAREAPKKVKSIIEIDPGMAGVERYILLSCDIDTFTLALRRKPMPQIRRVVRLVVDLDKAEMTQPGIPGIELLRAAREAAQRYHREFRKMMEDGHNDGARPPRKPTTDPDALAREYPIAAAYLKAEAWEGASHYVKAGIGRRAKSRKVAGEEAARVIADMEGEWAEYCRKVD